ncbi:hypothetical protein [Rhodococcus sp. IEGM 1305]|nr:hypothetical protein [Rhodococcus sp. IEGM 1305]MDI9949600.1 hypothetical protein [Rhodococcus sp. IEGM 1305]
MRRIPWKMRRAVLAMGLLVVLIVAGDLMHQGMQLMRTWLTNS